MAIQTSLWTQKYAPANLAQVAGNEEARGEIKKWALEADRGKKGRPLLIHGACGIGKSAVAYALASEMGWEVLETNASDLRDGEMLKKIYGAAASSAGLYGVRRLILIDEIDSVSDRQEFAAIAQIVKESSQPIIFIANDVWNQKLGALRFSCVQVEMKKVNSASIRKRLAEIAGAEISNGGEKPKTDAENANAKGKSDKEGNGSLENHETLINIDSKIEIISKNASGDIRGALNDLQGTQQMELFDLERFGRDRDENIFEAVRAVFKTMSYKNATAAGNNYNTQEFDMLMKWLEENIPIEYEKKEEIAQAFSWLSRADVFKGRIMRRQHWGYLKYAGVLATAGIALSKADTYRKFSKYQFPSGIKMMGQTKKSRELMKGIRRKVAGKLHISMDDAQAAFAALSADHRFLEYLELGEDEMSISAELYKNEKQKKGKAAKKD
ncbi:MAG: AAA family ATPase [Candidatus Micrarchaeota archaeon]